MVNRNAFQFTLFWQCISLLYAALE